MAPKSNDKCPYRRIRSHGDTRARHVKTEAETASPGTLGATRGWKRPERILPSSFWRKRGPDHTLISDFRPPEL